MSRPLEFRVLGPVEVVRDGAPTRIGSSIQRTLLALLVMHPNAVVSSDRIVDVLWPDNPPDARRKLWFHVSKLRGLLQPGGGEDGAATILARHPNGYVLQIEADAVDASRFERLTRSARSVLEDDPARAAELLREALGVWRGEPFEDVLHDDAVSPDAARLNELRLVALEDRLDADLALGRAGELIPELEALVAEQPFRETLRAKLMLALYRTGRQADALAAYRQARRTLVDELGIEPSDELSELHKRILDHDPVLAGTRGAPAPSAAPREERKIVTVFFADLLDSTATERPTDPEDVRARYAPYYGRIRGVVDRFGGTIEKFIGNAVVALFGVPTAHEDDPERAVRAALAIRDEMSTEGDALRARIGVASGEALVAVGASEGEPVAVGEVITRAAGLRAGAPVDGVLVDDQTFRTTRDAIAYRQPARSAADAATEPISAWEALRVVARPGTDLSRHRSPFVGRERELAALRERLAWARSQRSPQLVTILGVPGIGKSRLVTELHHSLAGATESATWRQGRSLPYGDDAGFWALEEIVKAEGRILEGDPLQKAERKLRESVQRTVEDPAEARRIVAYLGALIGVVGDEPAAGRRDETFAAWRHFLEALADERLLVLVFEDLHWADDALLDFVDELVDLVSGVSLLVLATARPELLERRPAWAGGKQNALTISLPPLSEREIARLVAALLEQPLVAAGSDADLLARIGGNPLYAEQFCRILLEHGELEALPETLHGIVAARLDGLADVEKRLLQDAAVVGNIFWLGTLEAIGGASRGDAETRLQGLVRREFVQRAGRSSVAGDVEYAFRHELLRDVAYGEIPRAQRSERHRRAAEWIDSLGRPEDHAELLAHHYLAALDHAGAADEDMGRLLVESATRALHRAGLRAIRLSANDRAVEHLTRAITLLGRLPEDDERSRMEADLQQQLGVALFAQRGLGAPEVERAYTRATGLLMAGAPAADRFPAHFGLSIYHGHRGDFGRSMRLVERLTELASGGDDSMRLQALHARWMNSLWRGRIDDAVEAAEEGRAIYRPESHHSLAFRYGNHDPGVCAVALQALAFAFRGESVRAVSQMHEAIALGESLGHAATLAQPLTQLPWALQINGEPEATRLASERALALEGEVVQPQFFGIARAMRGWALACSGREGEGIAELETALADELQASHIWAAMIGGLLAEVHVRHGRPGRARELLDRMRSLTGSMEACVFEPDLLRVEGEWLRLAGRESDARRLLLQSIQIAQEQGSWAQAVRSALSLARSASDELEADLRLLANVYERLPAENDTDYGRKARALLGRGHGRARRFRR